MRPTPPSHATPALCYANAVNYMQHVNTPFGHGTMYNTLLVFYSFATESHGIYDCIRHLMKKDRDNKGDLHFLFLLPPLFLNFLLHSDTHAHTTVVPVPVHAFAYDYICLSNVVYTN